MYDKSMNYNLITNHSSKLKEKEEEIVKLVTQVKQLTSQPIANTGKGLDEVQARQRHRKMFALHESCKSALWFCDSFHLDLLKITFKVSTTKNIYWIDQSL